LASLPTQCCGPGVGSRRSCGRAPGPIVSLGSGNQSAHAQAGDPAGLLALLERLGPHHSHRPWSHQSFARAITSRRLGGKCRHACHRAHHRSGRQLGAHRCCSAQAVNCPLARAFVIEAVAQGRLACPVPTPLLATSPQGGAIACTCHTRRRALARRMRWPAFVSKAGFQARPQPVASPRVYAPPLGSTIACEVADEA